MAQSLAQIYLHLVFSTKDRRLFLKDPVIHEKMHNYLKGICKKQGGPWLAVGGFEDHVHIACRLSKTITVSALIKELKQGSSVWVNPSSTECPSSTGKTVTAFFRSARPIYQILCAISAIRRITIVVSRFR